MLDYFSLNHPLARFRSRLSLSARQKMYRIFKQRIGERSQDKILDVGVTPDNSLEDSNYFERFYPYPESIIAISIENAANIVAEYPGVSFLQASGLDLPFKDNSFDVVFSSAVIEHVGDFENQKKFISEMLRVAHQIFLTTPDRYHPVEFHSILPFIHWLPKRIHRKLLKLLGYDFLAEEANLNLCTASEIKKMIPLGASYTIDRVWFMGFPSNILLTISREENAA